MPLQESEEGEGRLLESTLSLSLLNSGMGHFLASVRYLCLCLAASWSVPLRGWTSPAKLTVVGAVDLVGAVAAIDEAVALPGSQDPAAERRRDDGLSRVTTEASRNLPRSVAALELGLEGHDPAVELVLAAGAVPDGVAHAPRVHAERPRGAGEVGLGTRGARRAPDLVGEVAALVHAVAILRRGQSRDSSDNTLYYFR